MSYAKSRRDAAIADDFHVDRAFACRAEGCPNPWTSSITHLCRWHSDAQPHIWPQITRDMLAIAADRALANAAPKPEPVRMTQAEKIALLKRMREGNFGSKTRAEIWAALSAKAERGEHLTPAQREMLKAGMKSEISQGSES